MWNKEPLVCRINFGKYVVTVDSRYLDSAYLKEKIWSLFNINSNIR